MTTVIEEEEDFESTDGDANPLVANVDRRYAGVRALWMKVIIRAVFDYVTYKDSTKLDKKKYAESSYEWLFKKSLLFNSFDNICRYLDLDPDGIRIRAKKMTRDDVAKIEHMERDYELKEMVESELPAYVLAGKGRYVKYFGRQKSLLAAESVSDEVF